MTNSTKEKTIDQAVDEIMLAAGILITCIDILDSGEANADEIEWATNALTRFKPLVYNPMALLTLASLPKLYHDLVISKIS
jgi:hypothetical protein